MECGCSAFTVRKVAGESRRGAEEQQGARAGISSSMGGGIAPRPSHANRITSRQTSYAVCCTCVPFPTEIYQCLAKPSACTVHDLLQRERATVLR